MEYTMTKELTNLLSSILMTVFVLFIITAVFISQKKSDNISAEKRNRVYICKNENCTTKYFRAYQLVRHYVQTFRLKSYEEKREIFKFEMEYKEDDEIGVQIYCPNCRSINIERSKSYDWMKNVPEFPELSYKELEKYDLETENPPGTKSSLEALKLIQRKIEDIEEIAAYQNYYEISDIQEKDVEIRLFEISEQVNIIKKKIHVDSVQTLANEILASIEKIILKNAEKEKSQKKSIVA